MSRPPGRLDAWSRRKAQVAEAEAAEARAVRQAAAETATAGKSDAEICAELGLPDPESLTPGDDFAAFLKKDVPARLRRVALRKLWRSSPALANVDGLVDYGEDFTMGARAGEVLATAYQVGKGFVSKALEPQGVAEAEPAEAPVQADEEAPVEQVAEAEAVPEPALEAELEPGPEPEPELAAPAPRRMRFDFSKQETTR